MRTVRFLLTGLLLLRTVGLTGQPIERVEPLSWWTGMKMPLQVMFYGQDIGSANISVEGEGLKVTGVHTADSPNYLFVDVDISPAAGPGSYTFLLEKEGTVTRYDYLIEARREGSAERQSFGPADLMYLLMPDRFANGEPSNDSTADTAEKVDRDNLHGRHGGDIQGIMDRLGYIADLGATALWITPLTLDDEPRYSYHGYACADYYRIDPRYGTNDLYREMVSRAHGQGIKVVMDVVTNHCGRAHWWMDDLPFADWINFPDGSVRINHAMAAPSDPYASRADLEVHYGGWFDRPMPDMNIQNPFMLRYLTQLFIWWVEWADLDGLRVDTYPYNEKYAMAQWAQAILDEYPNLNIVGEYWNLSQPLIAYWEGGAGNRDGFDSHLPSVMDFAWNGAVTSALATDNLGWGEGMSQIYNTLALDFVYRQPENLLIFLDNHDTDRFADAMDGDADRIKLGLTMLATTRGVPQLYYGTEMMLRSKDMSQGHGVHGWTFRVRGPGMRSTCSTRSSVHPHSRRFTNMPGGFLTGAKMSR